MKSIDKYRVEIPIFKKETGRGLTISELNVLKKRAEIDGNSARVYISKILKKHISTIDY